MNISDVQSLGQPVDTVHHARKGRKETEEEKRNAMQLAARAVTENGFLIVMKPTHVYGRFFVVNISFLTCIVPSTMYCLFFSFVIHMLFFFLLCFESRNVNCCNSWHCIENAEF